MAVQKKQHYVPKLLLRHFAVDEGKKRVNAFNVNTKFYKSDISLKGQCQENYFYGEDKGYYPVIE